MIFCTCFDRGYLDKGLVLYRSLARHCSKFRLYIACFDATTYEVLSNYKLQNVVLISWQNYETDALLKKKRERTRAEYYWTCTTHIIELILDHYHEEHCIYIDADIAFFSDPTVLLDEIQQTNSHIGIIEHRFNDNLLGRRYLRRSGMYCVEFNYFDQTEESRRALRWWKEQCWEWCYQIYEPNRMGDQKYLEKFPSLFRGVHIFENTGAGVAPWNLAQYSVSDRREDGYLNGEVFLNYKKRECIPLIFYHFQNICYLNENIVNIETGTHDRRIKEVIYFPYLWEIEQTREELKMLGISFTARKVSSSNCLMQIWEKYFMRFKVKSPSDLIHLDKVRTYCNGSYREK